MITMVSIYNKKSVGIHFLEMITLMLQAIPRGLIVLPSPIINFVDVGAKSRLWSTKPAPPRGYKNSPTPAPARIFIPVG
jgi:hypothetical protein